MAKIITVVSGKGGVGKSTFCANTAIALCEQGKKVLLIDGDISLRSLDLLLGIDEMLLYDWSDVISNRCDKDKARLFYNDRLQLLPAPLEKPESFDRETFSSLLNMYRDEYDFIFVDSPAGVGELPLIYSLCADECIVVATPDNVSARSAYSAGNMLINAGIPDEKLRLVINRFDKKSVLQGRLLTPDEIIDTTYIRLLGVIPEEKKLTQSSVIKCEISSRSRAGTAFFNIAGRISGKEIPLNL